MDDQGPFGAEARGTLCSQGDAIEGAEAIADVALGMVLSAREQAGLYPISSACLSRRDHSAGMRVSRRS